MPKLWVFVWLGLALLIPGVLISGQTAALAFTVSSTTVFALALIILGVNRKYLVSTQHFHDSLDVFVHNDAAPTLFVNDDGEITYANRAARTRFGDVEDKSLVLLLSNWSANPVNVIFRLQQKARAAHAARQDIVTSDGHLRLSAHHIGPQGFVWRLENLTEYQDQGADRADPISLPMLLINEEGTILHMNRALYHLTGARLSHIDRLFNDLPLRSQGLHQIMTTEGIQTVRVVEHLRDDARREVFLVPCSADEMSGAPTLRLFDELPVALVKTDASGKVLHANRRARRLLGVQDVVEVNFSALVKGLGRPFSDWIGEAAEGRTLGRTEVMQATRDDKEMYLQVSLNRLVEDGQVCLVAVLNDATELKTMEAQFVQSQKMQAIGQLAGGVAHDFNNLLTAISGYCDLLLLRHDEGDPDFGDLTQINQNANRAASLVSQLLAYSRKQNLQPETLDVRDTLSDLSHLLNRLLGERVKLNVTHGVEMQPVRADKRQLEQVLMNLVVNARDAMADGGTVSIETDTVWFHEELHRDRAKVQPGQYVSIRVKDTGGGIPADKLTKIFEPFYTTKKTGEGTGLGLSMVYGIIKQTGGFIFVTSALGQGSEFEILLPAHEKVLKPEIVPDVPVPRPRTEKDEGVVLLVEDEAPVRTFAARALRMRGYTVHEAQDAEEALELLKDTDLAVDVFVTDVIMPGKDGPTWVKEARKTRPDTRVVFVSGYAEESISEMQAAITNSVFLPKPFSLVELTEKVRAQMAA